MKKLFIIVLSLLPLVGFAFEQYQIQFPQHKFQSVNTYKQCTSYTPNITEVGSLNSSEYVSTSFYGNGPRKVDQHPNDPNPDPISDTPWVLMMLLIGFYILRKKWKRMHSLPL